MDIDKIGKRFFALIIDILIATSITRILLIIFSILFLDGKLVMIILLSFMYPQQLLMIQVIEETFDPSYFFYEYVFLLIYLIVSEIIYYIIMQMNFEQTLGQKWMKLTVKRCDGEKLSFFSVLLRALIKTISNYLFFIPYTILFFTKNQTLHDKVAGSLVVDSK